MKKISIENLIELLYAKLSKEGIDYINIDEISHVVHIIREAPNLYQYKDIIEGDLITSDDLIDITYTKKIDSFGDVKFEMSPEKAEEIISKYKEISEICDEAIDIMNVCEAIYATTNGSVYCKVTNPNDEYSVKCDDNRVADASFIRKSTSIFTDGDVECGEIEVLEDTSTIRNLVIRDATYAYVVDYINGYIETIEIRNIDFSKDSGHIIEEMKNIFDNRISHYKQTSNSPKVYKLYRN